MSDLQNRLKKLSPEQRALLEKKMREKALNKVKENKISVRDNSSTFPMSFEQERLWFLNQLNPSSAFYNMPAAIKITGKLNQEALEDSLRVIIERHQVLQSVFVNSEKGPLQKYKPSKFKLLVEKQQSSEEKDLEKILNDEANKVFDLENGPLFRFMILELNSTENILLLTFHHIIADGWSIGVLISELTSLYEAKIKKFNVSLDELPIQYYDFAEWRKTKFTDDVKEKEVNYWKNKLDGMPQVLELPTDKKRPLSQTNKGDRVVLEISKDCHNKLLDIGKQFNATPFMIYLAILEIVLYRFSGQDDFGIGTPTNGRTNPELKTLIGFFVNTIVMRAKVKNNETFENILQTVKENVLESFSHQNLPFENVVESIVTEKNITNSPLFQVMYDYQESPLSDVELTDIKLELLEQKVFSSKFDLLFILEDKKENQKLSIEYNSEIFLQNTISTLGDIFINVVNDIAAKSNKVVSQIPIISEATKNKLTKEWNSTKTDYPSNISTNNLFEQQVKKTPNNIAISFEDQVIDYSNLNKKANQIANYLLKHGAVAKDNIAIYMDRSIDLFAATIAVLKIGGAYVPVDNSYPLDRIQFMLNDTKAKFVLTQSSLKSTTQEFVSQKIYLDEIQSELENEKSSNTGIEVSPDSIAYIIYTSGSTGKPKGVAVPHRGINRLVINTNYVEINEAMIVAQVANTSFDAATFEIWGAFLNGAKLVIFNKEVIMNTNLFVKKIIQEKISTMVVTTALFNQVVNEKPDSFKSVHTLLIGGEKLDPETTRKALGKNSPKNLLNGYGPTENTTFSTWYNIVEINPNNHGIPIGRPISNSTTYILDASQNVVPIGVPGELYVGGDGLAKGYWNREELNKQVFINNPFSNDEDDYLYKTGDLVKYRADGNIEFIGRIDSQIKLRGFRIELGEIEASIKKLDGIRDAIVLVIGESSQDKKLVAYIVLSNGNEQILSEISKKIKKELPEYMIPKNYVNVDSIPLTPNGKVDKKALANTKYENNKEDILFIEPKNDLEKYLADLWKEILKVDKISINDNFFDLGGNSLQAAVFINRLQKFLNTEIQVQSIFLAPTIIEFSSYAKEYYSDLILEKFGVSDKTLNPNLKLVTNSKLEVSNFSDFKNTIIPLPEFSEYTKEKNPRAIFILSPPRSGSTLLRVMLEGHDKLFSPPELDLLSFNTLGERRDMLSGNYGLWLEATVRAVMELKNCSVEEATSIMQKFEDEKLSVKEFYGKLQEWAGNKILVDKTPTYGLDLNVLKRAEQYFENPLYVHLVRNPYASVYSFLEAKLDSNFFRYEHSFNRQELAELIWTVNHENILTFLNDVPKERQIRMKFEDLVTNSENEMKQLSTFLNIPYNEKLIQPYDGNRMTDAVSENSQMVGDFKFYLRKKIDTSVNQRWKNYHQSDFLSEQTLEIAEDLGYNIPKELGSQPVNSTINYRAIEKVSRDQVLPLSFAQQRLWFLEQLEPGKPTYNIPAVVDLNGKLDVKVLENSIQKIIERQESLRTYFTEDDGKAEQVILSSINIPLEIIDLHEYSEEKKRIESEKIIYNETLKPFDLSEPPLFRVTLLVLDLDRHILLLNMHHIISDGWSMEVFVKELAMFFSFYSGNVENPPQELDFQYVDFAVWQRNWLNGDLFSRQAEYWKEKLKDPPPLLELPTDFNRPAVQNQKGKRIKFQIESKLLEDSLKLSNEEKITPFVIFLTAFNILLKKYSQSDDILVGIPVAGRNRSEIEPIIGFFVNTLVMRNNLSENLTIRQLLHNVNQVLIEGLNNQEIPFEKIIDELKIERSLSHTPLFQVMFVYNNSPVADIELADLKIQPRPLDLGTSKYDLNVVLTKRNNKLTGVFEFDTDLFTDKTIETMIGHYQSILTNIIDNSSQLINNLSISDEKERALLISGFSENITTNESSKILHRVFEENLHNHTDSTAVVLNNKSLSYNELNSKANKLANYLLKSGINNESIVAVCLERSIENIICILAIWKAGGTYLPLDPSYPVDRIDFMIENSTAKILITESNIGKSIKANKVKSIILSEEINDIDLEDDENLDLPIFSKNLAYMIYTSGSTGKPKGVTVQHQSAINLANELKDKIYSHYGKKLNISLNAPFPFDASMQEIVMLLFGHTLIIIPEEIRLDGRAFLNYMQEKNIDLLDCVPTQLRILIEHGLLNNTEYKPKIILVGGEPIDLATWENIKTEPKIKIFNMYGPTECTVDSTICEINEHYAKAIIGKPVKNAIHYILDENLNIAPLGVPGELYIGGDCIARGYYGNTDLTAVRFIPDPFSNLEGSRMYRTGDLVRYMHDGNIEYLRRIDDQVKLRGFRIELGEIESILNNHEAIKSSVVLIKGNDNEDKKLVAYYILEDDAKISVSELKELLTNKLPQYMVPLFYVELEEFPLLPNKKINRKAFPEPKFSRDIIESEYKAASTEIENILVDIWRDILKVDEIGVDDNFFELGGDSILGIQLISKANQSGILISPKNLFQSPTIRGLAALSGKTKPIQAEQETLSGPADLLPIQHWFFSQKFANPDHWNQSILLELVENLDVDILQNTFDKLIEHHDVLRLKFDKTNENVEQNYLEDVKSFPFELIDLSEENHTHITKLIENESEKIQASLNLKNGQVVKFAYFKCPQNLPDYLLLVAHHLVIDSVSWRIITEDLQKVYLQLKNGVKPNLPLKTTSLRYWSKSLGKYANSDELLDQLEFWKNMKLQQSSISISNNSNTTNTERDSGSVSFSMDEELTDKLLKQLPKIYNTDIKDVLLATLVKANASWKGSRKICVTLEGHGREALFEDVDLSRTVGWFTSIYPLVLDLEDSISSVEALKVIKEQVRNVPNNGIGYGILRYVSKNVKCSDLPHLSEISFNYLGQFNIENREKDLFKVQEQYKGSERAKENSRQFELDIMASIVNGKLFIKIVYGNTIFSPDEIDNLAELYNKEIQKLIDESLSVSGGYTPSDFDDVNLDDQDLDSIFAELND